MMTREEILNCLVAHVEALCLEHREIPGYLPADCEFDAAECRAGLAKKFAHPVYKVCSDFHYLGVKCCTSTCHTRYAADMYWIETAGGYPAYVCCAICDALELVLSQVTETKRKFAAYPPSPAAIIDEFEREIKGIADCGQRAEVKFAFAKRARHFTGPDHNRAAHVFIASFGGLFPDDVAEGVQEESDVDKP